MTDKERERQEEKIRESKQDSDFEWLMAGLLIIVVIGFVTI